MSNLSFCDLSKSFWKDKNCEKAKRALKKNHTTAKEYFVSRETLCLLCSSHLYSVLRHIMQDITRDIRHQWALTRALPAFLYFPPHEHPKGVLRCNLILCSLQCPFHTAKYYNSPHPSLLTLFSCIYPCCCSCACGEGDLVSALAQSSPCPACKVMAKAPLISFWSLPGFGWA